MSQQHWDNVYTTKFADAVSWFQAKADVSLRLMDGLSLDKNAPVIDVGGGASVLVDGLLKRGHANITVLDIAQSALDVASARLAAKAKNIDWLCADVLTAPLPKQHYQLWHDRAVFHFLTEPYDRARYRMQLADSVQAGGYLLMATFAEDGPLQCSGLPICRYSIDDLVAEFVDDWSLVSSEKALHHTPMGTIQSFVFALFKRKNHAAI